MDPRNLRLAAVCLFGVALFGALVAIAAMRKHAAPGSGPSIHVQGEPGAAERLALARISFAEAERRALARVPGKLASGEIEAEDGYLAYRFTIVPRGDASPMEVEVDAGDGKVLKVVETDDD
jgi:uncharacterized membrane protein YkoI